MEETLPAVKDEKIAELFAIRAGLSVISKNTDEIKKAEDQLSGLNIGKCKYVNKQISDYQLLTKEYNDKISAIESDIENLFEGKYPIESIENGKTTLYDLKTEKGYSAEESIKTQNEQRERGYMKHKSSSLFLPLLSLVFLVLFIAPWIRSCVSNYSPQKIEFVSVTVSFIGNIVLFFCSFSGKEEYGKPYFFVYIPQVIKERCEWQKNLAAMRESNAEMAYYEEVYAREMPQIVTRKRQELAAIKKEKDIELSKKQEQNQIEKNAFEIKTNEQIRNLNDEIAVYAESGRQVAAALNESYPWFSESDWINTDLVIFYMQTGRADSIKEALYQVDRQRQTEQIVKAMSQAVGYLSDVIGKGFSSLKNAVESSLTDLSYTVQRCSASVRDAIKDNTAIIEEHLESSRKMIDLQRSLISETQLNNSLLEKSNETSDTLLNDLRYQQKYWVK